MILCFCHRGPFSPDLNYPTFCLSEDYNPLQSNDNLMTQGIWIKENRRDVTLYLVKFSQLKRRMICFIPYFFSLKRTGKEMVTFTG